MNSNNSETELIYRGELWQISLTEENTHFCRKNSQTIHCSNHRSRIEFNEKDSSLVNFCFSHFSPFSFHMFVQVLSLLLIASLVLLGALHMLCGSGDVLLSSSLIDFHFPC